MGDHPGALAGRHVLLAVGGGIAAYKAAELTGALLRAGATVQVIMTRAATTFVGPATFAGLTGRPAHADLWSDPAAVLHVRLARAADVAVVAPATANLLAKFATGVADDLVTSAFTCLAAPTVLAPAMHTEMWEHPATRANVATLIERGARVVGPEDGPLAGGDTGPGRLAETDRIVAAVAAALGGVRGPLSGLRALVTAGGTREPIDPVRYIGNRSSGKMGYAIATELVRRGARVDLVAAPTALPDPAGTTVHRVETALEMRAAVLPLAEGADVVVKAAAVADYRPATYSPQKIKKETGGLRAVELERTPDILAELGARPRGPLLVGFAAETELAEEHGRDKLHRKGLDLIVVNRVDAGDAGFAVDTNRAVLLTRAGGRTDVPLTTKAALAAVVCDHVEALLEPR